MASTINAKNTSTGVVITPDASGQLELQTADTTRMTITSSGNVGIGTSSPTSALVVSGTISGSPTVDGVHLGTLSGYAAIELCGTSGTGSVVDFTKSGSDNLGRILYDNTNNYMAINTNSLERMRIDSSGNVNIGKTSTDFAVAGTTIYGVGAVEVSRNAEVCYIANRLTNDGDLFRFYQAGVQEGSISVSGTTVSYNGGHISRWSQLYNETTKVEVYRGTVLESVDAMCEWYDEDGNLLHNEQSTKTIISTTPASKAVAGVFDRYDEDDQENPYDFYVAQSGDFVIRLSAGTIVQNGDLLESAGDGTARVQEDDICRSSTIAKVTSNYVSETYPDGSFCVPCILMIG